MAEEAEQMPKLGLRRRALSFRNRYGGAQVDVASLGDARHTRQMIQIEDVRNQLGVDEWLLLPSRFERGAYVSGDRYQRCCLFNVIVAFEWEPTYHELKLLRDTCDEAADLLFDATDGSMTFNRFVIGGPELMACADIQIFASNRLYPRSWVNGLFIEEKYQPIRIGRGYWRKRAGRADPWNKNLGAAVLVHEWLHYALGLKDSYVMLTDDHYALPTASPVVNTLMANLESSEILPDPQWKQLLENEHFSWLQIQRKPQPQDLPPSQLPSPAFEIVGSAKRHIDDEAQVWLDWKQANLGDVIDSRHCWVFVLIDQEGGQDGHKPARLIAQGSYEDVPGGYRIIGAKEGALIILIGRERGLDGRPKVAYNRIGGFKHGAILFSGDWRDATPQGPQPPLLYVDISDNPGDGTYQVQAQISPALQADWEYTIFPLSTEPATSGSVAHVRSLDGHVLAISRSENGEIEALSIANYSIGGSPGAAYPAGPNPVPAGSSDGNAMIFFYDEDAKNTNEHPAASLRIITATNLINSSDPNNGTSGARSYIFGIMPNEKLFTARKEPQHAPTLVLYFDNDTVAPEMPNSPTKSKSDPTLEIQRLTSGGWTSVGVADQKVVPADLFVAARLNDTTAPGLFKDPPQPEFYRLFLVEPAW